MKKLKFWLRVVFAFGLVVVFWIVNKNRFEAVQEELTDQRRLSQVKKAKNFKKSLHSKMAKLKSEQQTTSGRPR